MHSAKTHAGTDARKEGRKDPHRAASFGIVDQKERKNNGRVRKPQTGRTEGENPVDRIDFDSPLCALLSFCVIAKYTSSPTMKINAHAIQSLDDKKTTALELTAAATAASAAITLIPGDAGTPIADKLADLSSYFLIVVCAIYLEKYLVTITGLAAFKLLIPIGCILLSLCFGFKKIWAEPLPVSWFCLGWLFIW